VAYGAIPDGKGVIHGCVAAGGSLRVVDSDAGDACRPGETALDWNQQGAPGLPGPAGASGPHGLPGAQGPAGVATTYARSVGGPVALKNQPKTIATITVPRGTYAVFAKAVAETTQPGYTCPSGTDVFLCVLTHNERRLASTMVGCTASAGAASDLARANLIAGANSLNAAQTVTASVVETVGADSNKVRLRCLEYGGGKWPARITNARLIAMKVDPGSAPGVFAAVGTKLPPAEVKPKLKPLRQVLE
jgi:hypothetical protein